MVVWPMVEFEADDALAAGDPRVGRVIICTPDKDLAQCVRGVRIVQLNRRTRVTRDEAGVVEKVGVSPTSIPDYLALVGDAADGYPGLPGWGAKSSAAVLARVAHLESIPADWHEWRVNPANASALATTLSRERDRALLFRTLATLRTDIGLFDHVDQLRWNGPTPAFAPLAARMDAAVSDPSRPQARRAEMGKYNEELVKAGVLLAAEGLHPSSKGARVKFSGENSEIEIRQVFEAADFGPALTPELRKAEERMSAQMAAKVKR